MHNFTDREYEEILFNVVKDMSNEDLKKSIYEFVLLLAHDHKLSHGNHIVSEFIKIAEQKEGIDELELTTARPLTASLKETICNLFSKNVELTEKVDPSLIGGFIARTSDMIVNASIKGRLSKFKEILTQ